MSRTLTMLRVSALVLLLVLFGVAAASHEAQAVRHHFYVGTISAISTNALTIHSKSHNADFHFTIDSQTRFLQHGKAIPRTNFHVGSYVTVSFSPGPHNSLIAYHISLRR